MENILFFCIGGPIHRTSPFNISCNGTGKTINNLYTIMLIPISAVCNLFLPLFPCTFTFSLPFFWVHYTVLQLPACLPACLSNTDVFEIFEEKNLASLHPFSLFIGTWETGLTLCCNFSHLFILYIYSFPTLFQVHYTVLIQFPVYR